MKIRKKTSFMLLAASTAAVVGVAAVSFAAWQGSNTGLTANAATGSAYLFGFTEEQTTPVVLSPLVPYNQDSHSIKTGATVATLSLPAYEVLGSYDIEVIRTDSVEFNGVFYVQFGEKTAPVLGEITETNTEEAQLTAAGWKKVGTTDGTKAVLSQILTAADSYAEGANKISFILVSSATSDMDKDNITFSVTLVEKHTHA